jgi:hypothetical protein
MLCVGVALPSALGATFPRDSIICFLVSVRPSSHITAYSSIDSMRHHPSKIESLRGLRLL